MPTGLRIHILRILSGDLEPSSGSVVIDAKTRMSVLKQDHYAYNDYTVLDTVISGNPACMRS